MARGTVTNVILFNYSGITVCGCCSTSCYEYIISPVVSKVLSTSCTCCLMSSYVNVICL